jgi:VCBS repeat-containing protein
MTTSTPVKPLILLTILLSAAPAAATQLVSASLKNGDYGAGAPVAPTSGVVATPTGVVFVPTEPSGRSNALVNWQIGNNAQWRRTGTITFLFRATRGQFVPGEILGDNYGFGMFHNGQAAFGGAVGIALHGPGPEDDRVSISWKTWHAGVWYSHSSTEIEYDRWYSVGFAWGGPFEFEIWVNQVRKSAVNIPGSFPWGMDNPPSGYNMGLGDNHERGVDPYNSAAGVSFADVRMWNEYRALGDTVDSNHAPTSTDDSYSTDEDVTIAQAAPGVLDNDDDQDGDPLTAAVVNSPLNGTLDLHRDGSFTYQPNAGFHGTDTFTYTASDGSQESTSTVTINVLPVNHSPVANTDNAVTNENTPITIDALANDTDADGDQLTITQAATSVGAVALVADRLLFTPPPGYAGPATLSYTISDGEGGTAQGTINVVVIPVNHPPVAVDDVAMAVSGITAQIAVLANDSDPDGDALVLTSVGAAGIGSVAIDGNSVRYHADVWGGLVQAIEQIPGLNNGQRTSLLARLRNAQRAFERGHIEVGLNDLRHVADALERFSFDAAAARVVALLRAFAAGALTDQFEYSISDGRGGQATARVLIAIAPQ